MKASPPSDGRWFSVPDLDLVLLCNESCDAVEEQSLRARRAKPQPWATYTPPRYRVLSDFDLENE